MENKTFEFVTFAILIESLITYISQFFIQESFCWQMALSLILGSSFLRTERTEIF